MFGNYLIKVKQVPLYYYAVETSGYFDFDCFIDDKDLAQASYCTQEEAEAWLKRMQELFPTIELVLESID